MGNTGKPSRGCQSCKDRKVKCDQATPTCRRCERNGRHCPGYPSVADVTFRNTLSTQMDNTGSRSQSVGSSNGRLMSISPPLSIDWHSQSVCMFFRDYVIQLRDSTIGSGWLENLPDLEIEDKESSAMHQAVSAVSLTSLAHRSSCFDYLVPEARQEYGKALRLVFQAMQDPKQLKQDSTLATVLCLGVYEVISGEMPPEAQWSSHTDILELLLRVRYSSPHESESSKHLSYNAQAYLQLRNLGRGIRPNKEAFYAVNDLTRPLPIRQMASICCDTCNFLVDVEILIQQVSLSAQTEAEFSNTILSGLRLEQRLETWSDQATGNFRYRSTILHGSLSPKSAGAQVAHPIYLYSSFTMAQLWMVYRVARIILLHCLMRYVAKRAECGTHGPSCEETNRLEQRATATIRDLVDDICASVPYMLGDVDQDGTLQHSHQGKAIGGFFLLWPLRTALWVGIASPEQRTWIMRRLDYIKNVLGIQMATKSVPPNGTRISRTRPDAA